MNDQQAQELYDILMSALMEHELMWILQSVEAAIAEGRVIEKTLTVEVEVPTTEVSGDTCVEVTKTRKRKVKMISNEAYDHKQRLHIMLDAIEQGLVIPAFMANAMLGTSKLAPNISAGGIKFKRDSALVSESPAIGPEDEFELTITEIEENYDKAEIMQQVIAMLREEV